jgi:hypothetical protein
MDGENPEVKRELRRDNEIRKKDDSKYSLSI